ncbi:MAG TPA: nuclear transport factor 2 family protein [Acidimicrobiales bacterium]
MAPARTEVEGTALVERMVQATNDHNLDALVACFASDYRNETPAHPERGFVGNEQVRLNWTQIFGAIPDLSAEVLRCTVNGDTVWTEWEHRGTRPDGSSHVMRGVVIFGVADGLAAWARFYLEPVQEDAGSVNEAVRRQVTPGVRG